MIWVREYDPANPNGVLRVIQTIDYKGSLIWDDTKPDGTPRKLTDVTKLHALGWKHKIEIEDGVPRLYKWYLDNL